MKKDVSEYDQYLLNLGSRRGMKKGEKIGEERGVEKGRTLSLRKFIRNRWKEHVTETQLLKDLKSYFELDENEARRHMDDALAKA